jgi:hypothetical protein
LVVPVIEIDVGMQKPGTLAWDGGLGDVGIGDEAPLVIRTGGDIQSIIARVDADGLLNDSVEHGAEETLCGCAGADTVMVFVHVEFLIHTFLDRFPVEIVEKGWDDEVARGLELFICLRVVTEVSENADSINEGLSGIPRRITVGTVCISMIIRASTGLELVRMSGDVVEIGLAGLKMVRQGLDVSDEAIASASCVAYGVSRAVEVESHAIPTESVDDCGCFMEEIRVNLVSRDFVSAEGFDILANPGGAFVASGLGRRSSVRGQGDGVTIVFGALSLCHCVGWEDDLDGLRWYRTGLDDLEGSLFIDELLMGSGAGPCGSSLFVYPGDVAMGEVGASGDTGDRVGDTLVDFILNGF